jgi:predicted nuclease of predicted toxin-antitoxin system
LNFLLDEDVPIEIARALREAGFEAACAPDLLGKTTADNLVWARAIETKAIVITCNRNDFLRLAGQTPQTGLIILNRRRTRVAECNHVLALIRRDGEQGLHGNINFA